MPTPVTIVARMDLGLSKQPVSEQAGPLWKGPCSLDRQGGITQGLISRWLVCRERFRLRAMEGWERPRRFDHKTFYGDCFHLCEEHWLKEGGARAAGDGLFEDDCWIGPLSNYAIGEAKKYPAEKAQIEHWYWVCRAQFPVYVDYWNRHPATSKREPLLQEYPFRVPYRLPSGRVVQLRGKWDSVDLEESAVWAADHKTKGDIDAQQLARQLTSDLQCMTYLVALCEATKLDSVPQLATLKELQGYVPVKGIRYNCVRRPLSGGKGTIVQKKGSKNVPAETADEFYARVSQYMRDDPAHFFQRFQVEVTGADLAKFCRECLDPVLENICDDFEWWDFCASEQARLLRCDGVFDSRRRRLFPDHCPRHYRMPFGVYSPLIDARSGETDLDGLVAGGSDIGLIRATNLFPEL